MDEKVSQFNAVTTKGLKTKLKYEEVLKKLDIVESIYAEIMGSKSDWPADFKENVAKNRITCMLESCNIPAEEDEYWYQKG